MLTIIKISSHMPVWVLLAFRAAGASTPYTNGSTTLPIVDLGYERHQAISFDETVGTYNFSNIRYAQPPVGNLRFRAPVAVIGNSSTVNNGSVGSICPQPSALFNPPFVEWITAYLQGNILNFTQLEEQARNSSTPASPPDPRVTEDCLFLDMIVPKAIFDNRAAASAPVLVWIYGGAYIIGEKTGFGDYDPSGMIQASRDAGDDGFIFVAMNYRVGAFGFLGGSTLQADGAANAGLLDQRMALDWVKQNVHLFGGSADRVTIMGESAGGGSVLHQLTAYGGTQGPVPFQQIIPQSAYIPITSAQEQEDILQTFMASANVSTLEELRAASFESLDAANAYLAETESRNFFTTGIFRPTVDGTFVPQHAVQMLVDGAFDHNVTAMIGVNTHEGVLSSDPLVNSSDTYATFVRFLIPGISNASLSHIENVIYPPVFDGSEGYTDNFGRSVLSYQELVEQCNAPLVSWALQNRSNNYLFAIPPGIHGEDIAYTFYHGPNTTSEVLAPPPTTPAEIQIAGIMQSWFASFVTHGQPTGNGTISFQPYGSDASVMVINETSSAPSFTMGTDPTVAHGACAWFADALRAQTLLG